MNNVILPPLESSKTTETHKGCPFTFIKRQESIRNLKKKKTIKLNNQKKNLSKKKRKKVILISKLTRKEL